MRVLAPVLLLTVLAPAAQEPSSAPPAAKAPNPEQTASPPQEKTITLNAGVKVVLAMVGPVWSKSAKPGDTVRAVSAFPVTIGNAIAIPPGTFVEGIIDALTRPTWRTKRADFQMHFTKLIFVNGYTVDLPDAPQGAATARPANSLAGPTATASVRVDVSYASDILLDNGSQFEMVVQRPISLDARQVAVAAAASVIVAVLFSPQRGQDVVLEAGSQIEMVVQSPFSLDVDMVAAAVTKT
jgi:hypothetical protein